MLLQVMKYHAYLAMSSFSGFRDFSIPIRKIVTSNCGVTSSTGPASVNINFFF
jgi:hypothetical protein